jgi:hypothetical protein
MKYKSSLIKPLIFLSLLYLVLIISGKLIKNADFSDYLINISVEVLGAIITIIFIDIYLNRHEKRISSKRQEIALSVLKPILRSNFSIIFNLFKASTAQKGNCFKASELNNFLNDEYIETIKKFDISTNAPVSPTISWRDYLYREFVGLNNKYEALLDKYSLIMDPELVEAIEGIKNSAFHTHMTTTMPTINAFSSSMPQDIFGQVFDKIHVMHPYFNYLKSLLKQIEDSNVLINFFEIHESIWKNNVAPQIGSSRLP